jgi:uncharacterized membrane protein
MQWTVATALEHWEREGLLTRKQVVELHNSLGKEDQHLPSRALSIFGTIGAVLVGLGVILFFASNWQEMTQATKLGVLLLGIVSTAVIGYWLGPQSGKYPKVGASVLLLNALLFGASIFLVAQIYHLPLNYWWGTFLWFVVTTYFAFVLQSRVHIGLAVPLLLFTIGWFRTTYLTGFANELDFIFDDRGSTFGLFPIIGAGFIAISVLQEKWPKAKFGSQIVFNWGLFLTLFPIVISTVDRSLLYGFFRLPTDPVALGIVAVAAALIVFALLKGQFQSSRSKQGFIALVGYLVYIHVLAQIPVWMGYADMEYWRGYYNDGNFIATFWKDWTFSALFVVHVILTFVMHLTVIWFGTLMRRSSVVNMGMFGIVALIMIQYFSFGFEMMDRSIFFILGGLMLLGLSTVLERKRRDLLATFS